MVGGESMTKYHTFDVVRATFRPKRTDDLKPGVAEWIGWTGLWQANGLCPEGPYDGQMGFSIGSGTMADLELPLPPWSWMPECDLEIHEDIVVLENA